MPVPDRRPHLWRILTPWKYSSRRGRFVGTFCLTAIIVNLVATVVSVDSIVFWIIDIAAIGTVAAIDMVSMWRDGRRYKRHLRALRLWSQVIDGKIRIEDLSPADQEEIAIQRALVEPRK